MNSWRVLLGTLLFLFLGPVRPEPAPLSYIQQALEIGGTAQVVTIPEGYRLEVLATRLAGPRMLSFGKDAELFIGSKSGRIYRLIPPYHEYVALMRVRGYPHDVIQRDDKLFISRTDSLLSIDYLPGQGKLDRDDAQVLAAIPGGGGHNSRTLGLGPE